MTKEYKATLCKARGGGEETEARLAKDSVENSDKYSQGLLCSRAKLLAEGVFVRDRGTKVMV